MFKKRIGLDPHANGLRTSAANGCPDIWELNDGMFAIIGIDKTESLMKHLPPDASCGEDERIVVINRHVLVNAKNSIPDK